MILYSLVVLLIAILPVAMFFKNASGFRTACSEQEWLNLASSERVSILIPARNEAASIGHAIDAILSNGHLNFEVLVLDDHSDDETASQVQSFGARDSRVRLLESNALPALWNGKQHACWQLANHSKFEWLLFLDADVRLTKDAVSLCCGAKAKSGTTDQRLSYAGDWNIGRKDSHSINALYSARLPAYRSNAIFNGSWAGSGMRATFLCRQAGVHVDRRPFSDSEFPTRWHTIATCLSPSWVSNRHLRCDRHCPLPNVHLDQGSLQWFTQKRDGGHCQRAIDCTFYNTINRRLRLARSFISLGLPSKRTFDCTGNSICGVWNIVCTEAYCLHAIPPILLWCIVASVWSSLLCCAPMGRHFSKTTRPDNQVERTIVVYLVQHYIHPDGLAGQKDTYYRSNPEV